MRFLLLFSAPLLFAGLMGCGKENQTGEENGPAFYQAPEVRKFIPGGYAVDPVSQDSILPVITSSGDTLATGIPIQLTGREIVLDTFQPPVKVNAGEPAIYSARENITLLADAPPFIRKKISDPLEVPFVELTQPDTSRLIINDLGQKVYTGVVFRAVGKTQKCKQPVPIEAGTMYMKDNSIYDLYYMNQDQGMMSAMVNDLVMDQHGTIWFGSESGLTRYDGKRFAHYTYEHGLSGITVSELFLDSKQNLWIGAWNGISKFDGHVFTHYGLSAGLIKNIVSDIGEDSRGNIWFSTYDGGLTRFDGENFLHFTEKEGLLTNDISALQIDDNGNLWIGSALGISQFDGKTFRHYTGENFPSNSFVREIEIDSRGLIWMATFGGALYFDGIEFVQITTAQGMPANMTMDLAEDANGDIWLATIKGVAIYDGEKITRVTTREGLAGDFISHLLMDPAGNCWLASAGGGLHRFRINSFEHFNGDDLRDFDNVASMEEDKNGNLWFGTNNGVYCLRQNQIFHYTRANGLNSGYIPSICAAANGDVWFTASGFGLNRFDGTSIHQYGTAQGFPWSVSNLLEDRNGNLWITTGQEGLFCFDGNRLVHYSASDGFLSDYLSVVEEAPDGKIWIGTSRGLCAYDETGFTYYTLADGFTEYMPAFILPMENGCVWTGVIGQGLYYFDGKQFTHYTSESSPFNLNVYSGITSPDGSTWFSMWNGGLVQFKNGKFHVASKADGLKSRMHYNNSALLDSKGNAWWGSNQSLIKTNLSKYQFSEAIPQPHLRYLTINEVHYDFAADQDSLQEFFAYDSVASFENYPVNLRLPSGKNHLTFYFSAIEWEAPHKLQYQYKLEGLDNAWSEVTTKTFADYRNIPYGDYVFKFRAVGESQIWSEPFEYHFEILPPWYHTWWFRILFVVLLVVSVVMIVRWRTAQLRFRQIQLERDIARATIEIRIQKNEVEAQKERIEEVHKEITDSILYAERLQRSLMASKKLLDRHLDNYFVYFNPKEAVSGDFYWASVLQNEKFAIACADSTGHGVPGAIMSMMNMNSLKECVKEGLEHSDDILNASRKSIIETLANDGSAEGGKDGMDVAFLILDKQKNEIEFSLANNPLWLVRSGELLEFSADRMPVGKHDKQDIPFRRYTEKLVSGDMIYIFSDGFADQFGGEKGKKFKYAALKNLFLEMAKKPVKEQQNSIHHAFNQWRGSLEQVDDVCIIGIQIGSNL